MNAIKKRRTQKERRDETRGRLLDATVDCLVRYGYAGTTTTLIADRAGVSRGAQVHHFPTKGALVRAAVEHFTKQRVTDFRAAMAEVPPGADRIGAAIDLLWQTVGVGERIAPWLELVVAARTDPELADSVEDMHRRFRDEVSRTFADLFPDEVAANPFGAVAPIFASVVVDGLALQSLGRRDELRERLVIETLKQVATLAQLSSPGGMATPPRDEIEIEKDEEDAS